jgi:hypothetical protein
MSEWSAPMMLTIALAVIGLLLAALLADLAMLDTATTRARIEAILWNAESGHEARAARRAAPGR